MIKSRFNPQLVALHYKKKSFPGSQQLTDSSAKAKNIFRKLNDMFTGTYRRELAIRRDAADILEINSLPPESFCLNKVITDGQSIGKGRYSYCDCNSQQRNPSDAKQNSIRFNEIDYASPSQDRHPQQNDSLHDY